MIAVEDSRWTACSMRTGAAEGRQPPESRWLTRSEIADLSASREDARDAWIPTQSPCRGVSARRRCSHRADADRSGLLGPMRWTVAGPGPRLDRDGDGRVTLSSSRKARGSGGSRDARPADRRPGGAHRARRGSGAPPGRDRPLRIRPQDRTPAGPQGGRRAVFAALDLDGDQRLDLHELSRHPGQLRELRSATEPRPRAFEASTIRRRGPSARASSAAGRRVAALDPTSDGFCSSTRRVRRPRELAARSPGTDGRPGPQAAGPGCRPGSTRRPSRGVRHGRGRPAQQARAARRPALFGRWTEPLVVVEPEELRARGCACSVGAWRPVRRTSSAAGTWTESASSSGRAPAAAWTLLQRRER